jgi:signal transduction histidine kinase
VLRPPQSLLAALAATTVVVTVAVCWAGWRLLDQQRAIDEQRAREQLDSGADAIASRISGRLAETGEWLSAWVVSPASLPPAVDGAVALAVDADGIRIVPDGGLPFVPAVVPARRPADAFVAAERLEFLDNRPGDAAARYRLLARSDDAELRAGALLRLGRVLRKQGDFTGALTTYRQLAALGAPRVHDLPAELAGLAGQRAVYAAVGDREGEQRAAQQVLEGLDGGRWLITRGVAEFHRESISTTGRPECWQLADAVSDVWRDASGRLTARGLRLFSKDDGNVLVFWRSGGARTALLAAFADRFFAASGSAATIWRLVDPEGRLIAGAAAASGRPVARIIGTSEYPWTLQVWPPAPAPTGLRSGRTLLLAMMGAMLMFVWAASYLIGRAIRREAGVARLQSDFVAAVSHEFRSPLTAIRQMAEMLEMDRLPTDERRRTYYRTMAREAARLQRLVETLLNFGRMEAGAARFQFSEVDAGALARNVVGESEPQARESGTRIETTGPEAGLRVRADPSALAVAIRNLIDNAIKYSPRESVVRIEWGVAGDRVAIRVVDRGPGIPEREQRAIFHRFVRGQAAVDGHVPGTGVGLAMVQDIVRAHGGEIRIESQVGHGSTFTILLPAAEERCQRS